MDQKKPVILVVLVETAQLRWFVAAVGLEIEARWDDLGEALFAYGPAPQRQTNGCSVRS